jgi:arginyl-tRNA synthetase
VLFAIGFGPGKGMYETMSKIVAQTEAQIREIILSAAGRAIAAGELAAEPLPDFAVEVPADRSHGDFAVNAAMVWARALRKAPRQIAETLARYAELSGSYIEKLEIAGPGFINLFLANGYYAAVLKDIRACGKDYGKSDFGKGQKIMVEFVSANPTGPMHMGNARGGALGDCLAAVLEHAGYTVSREFYINDAGNQIDKFALSLEVRYLQLFEGEDKHPLPEDCYQGLDIRERAEEFAAEYGDRYLSAAPDERRRALVGFALPKNIANMRANMEKYRIHYDCWFQESLLHENGELEETIELLRKNGRTYEKDGALWYKNIEVQTELLKAAGKTQEEIDKLELKDDVLIRANGNPTYFAADIAYHRNKLTVRGFDKAIDVWGADHHGHVARMKGALTAIGIDGDRLDVILMQLVRLVRDGEVVRMSKRTGKSITLTDLLEEIPISAVRFLFNMREAGSQMDFDLDLAVEQSAQNPVYYCQYAHARICSILKKLEGEGITPRDCTAEELQALTAPEERELIRHLSALTGEIVAAARDYDPARITRYVMELATCFHKFYNACKVLVEDEALCQARLYLCVCVRDVIRLVLELLGIEAPESM